jgi:hypothetical protein
MEFLKGLKEEIQVGPPLKVEGRTVHVVVRIQTLEDSEYFFKRLDPFCLAVEDCERYIIPIGEDISREEAEDVWKLVENLEKGLGK